MGDRANYAIRDNGQLLLHYSHWGAVTVAEDIFWGPAETEEFVRQSEVAVEWLDEVWAQGGIALDKDNRHLTYYCYEWPLDEDMRKVYDSLLAETWAKSGWTVQRAQTWSDVAYAVGVDRATVRAEPSAPAAIAWEELGENLKSGSCCAIVSVRTDDTWMDRAIDFALPGVLTNGSEMLDRFPNMADLSTLRAAFGSRRENDMAKTPGDWIDEFCAIDLAARSMRVSLPDYEEQSIPFLQQAWPGWTVVHERGGIVDHFQRTGRDTPVDLMPSPKPPPDPPPPNRPFEECVRLINDHLAGNENRKSALLSGHERLLRKLGKDGPVAVAPGFLTRTPQSGPGLVRSWRLMAKVWWNRLRH